MPEYKTSGAVAFDLSARENLTIAAKQIALVPTGLVVKIPAGHMLLIASRSSLPLKKGLMLANGVGIIDQDYCGPEDELKIQVFNFTDSPVSVERGDRLAQGIVVRIERCNLIEKPIETKESRGGFGSTGQK